MKQPKTKMTTLERTIKVREFWIAKMKKQAKRIQHDADEEIASLNKRISERQLVLDAIKRGSLQP